MDPMKIVDYRRAMGLHINKTADTGTRVFDDTGGYVMKILGKDDDNNIIATKFNLINVTDVSQLELPVITPVDGLDGNQISLTPLVQELIGPAMFHATDSNIHTIQSAINIILRNQATQDKNMNAIVAYFKNFSKEDLANISHSISEAIGNDYYKKSYIDDIQNGLNKRMKNIEARFQNNTNLNGASLPNYAGDYDTSDESWKEKLRQMNTEMEDNG